MSIKTQVSLIPGLTILPLQPADLATASPGAVPWLWHGYLAQGKVTALVSQSKSGKTTLVSHVLARMAQGGLLVGLAVRPGRALVVSEEATSDWDPRCRHLAIGPHVQFVCRPFQGDRPTEAQWFALIAGLEALHRQQGLDLVIIDTLATLLPGHAEASAPKLLDCLLPLQALASQGPAVWLLHHPARGKRADGQAGRGSSALSGFADILMEMSCYRRARSRDRRRRIYAYSRYLDQTPRHLLIELNADATDYLLRTNPSGQSIVKMWLEVEMVLGDATDKLSQHEILQRWPSEEGPPERTTLSRWLKRAAQQGLICCSGSGYRGDGFRYWLPGREPLLWPGYDASDADKDAWRERVADHYRRLREANAAQGS
jgi:hypothetical protein